MTGKVKIYGLSENLKTISCVCDSCGNEFYYSKEIIRNSAQYDSIIRAIEKLNKFCQFCGVKLKW